MKVLFIKKANLINFAIIFIIGFVAIIAGVAGNQTTASAAITFGNRDKNSVALTFGVYQSGDYLEQILDTLETSNIKATFFVGGRWVIKSTNDFKKIYEDGHELGNYGTFEQNHSNLSKQQHKEEISYAHSFVSQNANGLTMNLFMPPSLNTTRNMEKAAKELNYTIINPTTRPKLAETKEQIIERATSKIRSGDIIFLKANADTAEVLATIISQIRMKNLSIGTVSSILS